MAKATTKIISTSRPVKSSCKNTKVRTASGACAPERKPMMKKGGSTKFFPDLNKDGKVTKADILVGKGVIPKAKTGGVVKKTLPKAQDGKITKYKPWESNQQVDSIRPNPSRDIQLSNDWNNTFNARMLNENRESPSGASRKPYNNKQFTGPTIPVKKLGGTAHPGFKAVQSKIAAKQGISKEAAGAILASSARKASAKAKAANPRLKKVK